MTQEIYLDVFIIDEYEIAKSEIEKKTPREIQRELKQFF